MSRFKFVKMVNNYKSGEYVNMPKYDAVCKYYKCHSIKLESQKEIVYGLDGECGRTKEVEIKVTKEKETVTAIIDGQATVENNSGVELPGVGGMGTTLFTIIGGGVILIALFSLAKGKVKTIKGYQAKYIRKEEIL